VAVRQHTATKHITISSNKFVQSLTLRFWNQLWWAYVLLVDSHLWQINIVVVVVVVVVVVLNSFMEKRLSPLTVQISRLMHTPACSRIGIHLCNNNWTLYFLIMSVFYMMSSFFLIRVKWWLKEINFLNDSFRRRATDRNLEADTRVRISVAGCRQCRWTAAVEQRRAGQRRTARRRRTMPSCWCRRLPSTDRSRRLRRSAASSRSAPSTSAARAVCR